MLAEDISKSREALWFGLFPANDTALAFLHDAATLDKPVDYPHVTFGYKVEPPSNIDWDAIYDVEVFAYGNDEVNEGYAVNLPVDLEDVYFGAEVAHITLSTSSGGSPVNTAFIDFELTDTFIIPMKFGFYRRGEYYV